MGDDANTVSIEMSMGLWSNRLAWHYGELAYALPHQSLVYEAMRTRPIHDMKNLTPENVGKFEH